MLCRSWRLAVLACIVGCVDVPDSVRAQFAGPRPEDRTNYRPGNHGAEPAPVAKAAPAPAPSPEASTTTTTSAGSDEADAGVTAEAGAQ